MNRLHRWICRSAWWRRTLHERLLPWALDGTALGEHPLEIGPGPGLATDWLRTRHAALTAVEVDPRLAAALRRRLAGTNATVVEADATAMPFPNATFSGAVCFTMLHHVPSAAAQDRLLAEVRRVLRPGAPFVGTDSVWSPLFGAAHLFDTMVMVDPDGLEARLEAAGFANVDVRRAGSAFRFRALRP